MLITAFGLAAVAGGLPSTGVNVAASTASICPIHLECDSNQGTSLSTVSDAARFAELSRQWDEDTRYSSSAISMVLHPAYQEIMQMKERAVPYILQELQERGGHWFFALQTINRLTLGQPDDSFEIVRQLWLSWGRNNCYI